MSISLDINDALLQQLRSAGEVRVSDSHGEPVILMTVEARRLLDSAKNGNSDGEASEWPSEIGLALAAGELSNPDTWGAPGMEDYDDLYGHLFQDHGKD